MIDFCVNKKFPIITDIPVAPINIPPQGFYRWVLLSLSIKLTFLVLVHELRDDRSKLSSTKLSIEAIELLNKIWTGQDVAEVGLNAFKL